MEFMLSKPVGVMKEFLLVFKNPASYSSPFNRDLGNTIQVENVIIPEILFTGNKTA